MKFNELLHVLGDESAFESSFLFAGDVNPRSIQKQLSRWVSTGRIHQLRRGIYILADPYRKNNPHPFSIANLMVRGSYVSLQTALSYHGMIPEFSTVVTSVTTRRPGTWNTASGRFEYRHIKTELFHTYRLSDLGSDQRAMIATPEKALFDLLYLVPQSDTMSYLHELRLHFIEQFHLDQFLTQAEVSKNKKMIRGARIVEKLFEHERMEYESL